MKRKPYTIVWITCIIAAGLLLTACVRPVPTEPVATLTPSSDALPTQPDILPTEVVLITPQPAVPTEEGGTEELDESEAEVTTPEATQPAAQNQDYVVKSGDSMNKIAKQFGITPEELAQANDMNVNDTIHPGDTLIIPGETAVVEGPTPTAVTPPDQNSDGSNNNQSGQPGQGDGGVHVVQRGENLFRIGLKYGCTVNQMAQFNGIRNPNYIYPGQPLKIPPSC